MTTKGFLLYAHNNEEIEYLKLACVTASMIRYNLGEHSITVVTDQNSYDYTSKNIKVEEYIDNIIIAEKDLDFKAKNHRNYRDTNHSVKVLPFYNANRCDAYDISPYDETILIDADYLILSDTLNQCWGHNEELMMNWKWQDVMFERKFDSLDRLNDMGITMYWATVVYFRKTPYVESFFNTVKHVKDNSQFYRDLYKWAGRLYRNDYSFSVAAHTMSGFVDKGIAQLPTTLYKTFDTDDVHSAISDDTLLLLLEKPRSPGDFMLTKWSGVDLHVMNKWAINRISDGLMEYVNA